MLRPWRATGSLSAAGSVPIRAARASTPCRERSHRLLTGTTAFPPLPPELLAGLDDRYERVVLIYFDAFGFELACRHASHPLLRRAAADGLLTRITSQFPSTTTAHMPTIHSGQPVGTHGLYEWFILEPRLDRLIAPLPFGFAGEGQAPLIGHLRPEDLYPAHTFYEWLAAHGTASVVAGNAVHAHSPASGALMRGAGRTIGFPDAPSGLEAMAAALTAMPAPAYGFLYIEDIDSLMHRVGPGAPGSHRARYGDRVSAQRDRANASCAACRRARSCSLPPTTA